METKESKQGAEGRQMKGDKAQTRPERRTLPVTNRRTHLKIKPFVKKLRGEANLHRGCSACAQGQPVPRIHFSTQNLEHLS